MTVKPISGVTISLTKDEVEWLSWVMTEVLGKATHVPPHESVANKIQHAMDLVQEFKKFGEAWQQRKEPAHDVA